MLDQSGVAAPMQVKPATCRVLVIEDDQQEADQLLQLLADAGHAAVHARNGRDGLFMAVSEPYDVLIIDRRLPHMDGLQIIKTLRATGVATPAIFLSSLDNVANRVEGLRAGADDYLAKPFAGMELLARLEAVMRRRQSPAENACIRVADLELNRITHCAIRNRVPLDLKPREFSLLECLMLNAERVTTRTMLLETVWGYCFDPQTNVIDVHISRLRAKVDLPDQKPLIWTVKGSGYCLSADRRQ